MQLILKTGKALNEQKTEIRIQVRCSFSFSQHGRQGYCMAIVDREGRLDVLGEGLNPWSKIGKPDPQKYLYACKSNSA